VPVEAKKETLSPDAMTSAPEQLSPDAAYSDRPPAVLNPAARIAYLSSEYKDDPDKIGAAYHTGQIPNIGDATAAILYAQQKSDADIAGKSDWQANWDETFRQANQALRLAQGAVTGFGGMVGTLLQAPGRALGMGQNALDILAPGVGEMRPYEQGSFTFDDLKKQLGAPQPVQPTAIGAQGTSLGSPDIVTGGKGGNLSIPGTAGAGDLEARENLGRQAAARAMAVGAEAGLGEFTDSAWNWLQNLSGLTLFAPNAVLKAFGGPRMELLPPELRMRLATNQGPLGPIPIRSTQSYMDMDRPDIVANLVAGKVQAMRNQQNAAGWGSPLTEATLDKFDKAWTGQGALTPEQLQDHGVPVPQNALENTAATTNLAANLGAYWLMDRLWTAAGLKSLTSAATKEVLQQGSELSKSIAENIRTPQEPVPLLGPLKAFGKMAVKGYGGYQLGEHLGELVQGLTGIPIPPHVAGTTLGVLSELPISGPLVDKAIHMAIGWMPKLIAAAADQNSDILKLVADDPNNLLATRSALKQVLAKGVERTLEGMQSTVPLLPAARSPEEAGQILGMGAAGGLLHAPKDLANIARTKLGDATFITDNNYNWRSTPAKDPTPYGTNKWLDEQHAAAINATDPVTNQPSLSNDLKHNINDLRTQYDPLAEIYVLNPKAYGIEQQRMYDMGWLQNVDAKASGVTFDPNPGYKARILIRNDLNSINRALQHEVAHPIVNRLYEQNPEGFNNVFEAVTRNNDPNDFTLNYTCRIHAGGVDYDSLPTEEGIKNGTEQYVPGFEHTTKDDMAKEMVTEAVSGWLRGGSIKSLTRDPTLFRHVQNAWWGILDGLGFDPFTTRSNSVLGLKQATVTARVLEPLLRQTLRDNLGPNAGVPPTELERPNKAGFLPGEGEEEPRPPLSGLPYRGRFGARPGDIVSGQVIGPTGEPIGPARGAKPEGGGPGAGGGPAAGGGGGPSPAPGGGGGPGPAPQGNPGGLSDAEMAALRRKGFSDQQIADMFGKGAEVRGPADVVRESLKQQGFSPEEIDRNVPANIISASEAIAAARKAILAERAAGKPGTAVISQQPAGAAGPSNAPAPQPNAPAGAVAAQQQPASETPEPQIGAPGGQTPPAETTADNANLIRYIRENEGASPGQAQATVTGRAPVTTGAVPRGHITNEVNVVGSEFGEIDRPSRGGYTEPNWDIGKWGDDLTGEGNRGIALPRRVLEQFGNPDHGDFARNFNSKYDVVITNPETGQQVIAPLKDEGPGESTGAGIDMLWKTREDLGFGENFKGGLTYAIVPKGSVEGIAIRGGGTPGGGREGARAGATPGAAPPKPQAEAKPEAAPSAGLPTMQDITKAQTQARNDVGPQKEGQSDLVYEAQVIARMNQLIGTQHSQAVPVGDERVTYDPATGFTTGKFFQPGDPYNDWLLRNASPHDRQIIADVERAIRTRTELTPVYGSAPTSEPGLTTARGRGEAQAASPAIERAQGGPVQEASKRVIPSYVGVAKNGDVIWGGIDPAKVASNVIPITQALGGRSPYGVPLGPHFLEDLHGYLANQNAGMKGDGSAPLTPVPRG
jgi:hypothetical protein